MLRYVRVLGAFYLRLVGKPLEIYQYLEPLLNDYRKVRRMQHAGSMYLRTPCDQALKLLIHHCSPIIEMTISHVDEVIDEMLTKEYVFDIILPRIPKRSVLEVPCVCLHVCFCVFGCVSLYAAYVCLRCYRISVL